MHSSPKPLLDESQWVIRIRNTLEEEDEEEEDDVVVMSSSIAGVPKPLLSTKPEAYIPQLIALGPYHHDREELREMERYKLSAAKRIRTRLPNTKFRHLVDLFVKVEYRIRAHYQRYLPLNGETLAWMMAIDASFLLEFLQAYRVAEPDVQLPRMIPSKVARMASSDQRTSTHDMLLRDIIMLENQIPVFLLYKVLLEVRFSVPGGGGAEEALTQMLVGLLKDLTPFKMITDFQSSVDMKQNSHLLELLYHSIVPSNSVEEEEEGGAILDSKEEEESGDHNRTKRFVAAAIVAIVARTKAFLSVLFKLLIKMPWSVITSIPTFAMFKHLIESTTLQQQQQQQQMEPPPPRSAAGLQFEEIAIPCITELAHAGIRFEATDGGDLTSVAFDAKTATLRLPKISLDVNSEVVVRNLVAYETAVKPGALLTFTRYVELMNGMIDSGEDAKVLRERGVLVNGLRSDAEVAELWNGMSPSVRLTRVRFLDEVIEGVNSYYGGRWKVRAGSFVKSYVLASCRHSFLLLLLLLFMAFQAFTAGIGLWGWAIWRKKTP